MPVVSALKVRVVLIAQLPLIILSAFVRNKCNYDSFSEQLHRELDRNQHQGMS